MPRFFFHYQDGGSVRPDSEGVVLPDAEAALYHAVRSAREIIGQDLRIGALRPGQYVQIADEAGQRINAFPFEEVAGVAL